MREPSLMYPALNAENVSTLAVEIVLQGPAVRHGGVLVESTEGDERCWSRCAARHGNAGFELHRTHGWCAADVIRECLPARRRSKRPCTHPRA